MRELRSYRGVPIIAIGKRCCTEVMKTIADPLRVWFLGFVLFSAPVVSEDGNARSWSQPYPLRVLPPEDEATVDPETGAKLRFLTNGKYKDTNLYFHQRSWLADGSMVLFFSGRVNGGLMGYLTGTGELVCITASDGSQLRFPTAAKFRNSVFALAGDRVLEIAFELRYREVGNRQSANVIARERLLCRIKGVDVYLNESCDGRYLAVGGAMLNNANRPGLAIIEIETGRWERLCDVPEGVEYHGHVQWSMTNPYWLSFAGAPNRLWVVDIRDRKPWCPYREWPNELVTHEFWWVEDQLGFCGGLYPKPTEDSHVKLLDLKRGTVRIIGAGSWWPDATPAQVSKRNWWHASGSEDGRWIAADNWHGDIMLFEGKTSRHKLLTAGHRAYGGGEHPEVGWDRRGHQVVFASHKRGDVTVCIATIPSKWLEETDRVQVGLDAKGGVHVTSARSAD